MNNETTTPGKRYKISVNVHLIFCVLAAIVIYITVNTYVRNIVTKDDEEIAGASIFFFLGGIYGGRFLSHLWISQNKNVPAWILMLLPLIMTACIFASVFFADSLLSHQELIYALFLAFPLFILSVTSGMFVKLVREQIKKQLLEAQISAASSQSELQLLQSQLSPHFLFNTLNNMYGIAITQHEKIPDLLLKLSELLRYSVYESKELYVPLKDEFSYINNYIDFEKLRLGDRLSLTTDIGEELINDNGRIAPMLLIIFVENAFKHSRNTTDEKIFIDIAAKTWRDTVLFSVKNSYTENKAGLIVEKKGSGLGLENAKKRLELLYPGEYDLKLTEEAGFYTVMLRLNIKR